MSAEDPTPVQSDTGQPDVDDAPEQVRIRREKLDRLRAAGIDPYPVSVPRTATVEEVRRNHPDLEADVTTGDIVSLAGRVMLRRDGGKLCFATVRDATGDLQVMLSVAGVGEASLDAWKSDVDLGDIVSVTGEVITSRRGELSVMASEWTLASKSLRPLPDKWHGMTDPETRVRQRYVDLIVNVEARRMLEMRSTAVSSVRSSLADRGFLEVETPMLQTVHGGANARPFVTHINAYDLDLYLRIAPELWLKRLMVGGIPKVFEIGRTFRNEGADATHNPEFTMLEAYESYGDYTTIGNLTLDIVQAAAVAVFGSTVVTHVDGSEHDIGGEWPRVGVHEAIAAALGEDVSADTELPRLHELCAKAGIALDPKWIRGEVVLEMYERLVEHVTVAPTFFCDFPTDVSPLTRAHRTDPRVAERWDLVAFGRELGTGYSELIDPVEQRARLSAQSAKAAGGDVEAMQLDEEFLTALEFGVPPMGGMGMGIDRLLMILTGANVRETVTFPLVRPI